MIEFLNSIAPILEQISMAGAIALIGILFFRSDIPSAFAEWVRSKIKSPEGSSLMSDMKEELKTANLLASNHTSGLPEMGATLERIQEGIEKLIDISQETRNDMSYIRGRLNGKS